MFEHELWYQKVYYFLLFVEGLNFINSHRNYCIIYNNFLSYKWLKFTCWSKGRIHFCTLNILIPKKQTIYLKYKYILWELITQCFTEFTQSTIVSNSLCLSLCSYFTYLNNIWPNFVEDYINNMNMYCIYWNSIEFN